MKVQSTNSIYIVLLMLLTLSTAKGQVTRKVDFNKGYDNIKIQGKDSIVLQLNLQKGNAYQVLVQQLGIDVILTLTDRHANIILEKDSPNGSHGLEIVEYTSADTRPYRLIIKKFEEEGNADSGFINYYVKRFSKKELIQKEQTKTVLLAENQKRLLTLDIDHFWEAFDNLKNCKTSWDSILTFQHLYFDRATNGLKDFIDARQWSPEMFVKAARNLNKYYTTVRPYTFKVKESEPFIDSVFAKFKALYSNFKPFSVCFAIGFHNTAGTVSDRFVLLGAEMVTAGKNTDFSELDSAWKPNPDRKETDITKAVMAIVAHECVHTQQPNGADSNAVVCNQLYFCLREGAANFIGELISGNTNYSEVNRYGDAHEAALWNEFKSTLCSPNADNWMYNGSNTQNRPADLGYYIGYKICKAYYNNAKDKQQAIRDIIEIKDPLSFLQQSGYDKQISANGR